MTSTTCIVEELMWPHVFRVAGGDNILAAGRRMREFDIGSALVFEDAKLVGVITERDLLRAFVDCADATQAIVRDYMTPRPVTVDAAAPVGVAASLLIGLDARHLPVTKDGVVVGVLSARDLLPLMAGDIAARPTLEGRGRYDGPAPTLAAGA